MAAYKQLTDEQLVILIKNGDQHAFAEVYRRYAESLAGFAGSKLYDLDDARDVLHDMFVKLWENREQLYITSSLQSYLFTVIRRRIIDKIRKNVTREEYALIVQSLATGYEHSVDKQLEAKDLQQGIKRSLDQLSPRVREIYTLSRQEGLSNHKIAEKLDVSEQTVKNQLSAALKHLRKSLTGFTIIFLSLWLF